MRDHPLTPMTDANLVRVLGRQSPFPVGLVPLEAVDAGTNTMQERFAALERGGHRVAVVDAVLDRHVDAIGCACRDFPLVTGGADALSPARVRDDEELFALVAQLATLVERDRVGNEDLDTLQETFEELSRAVQLQFLDRAAGEWSAKLGTGDDFDAEAAMKLAEITRRQRELNPRARDRSADD